MPTDQRRIFLLCSRLGDSGGFR